MEKAYKAILKYNKLHPERKSAWNRVMWKPNGIIATRTPCYCGTIKVDGHHPYPLQKSRVIWVCRLHHKALHKTKLAEFKYEYLG